VKKIHQENIPQSMRELDQWVLWRYDVRGDKPTKLPYQIGGALARSNDPATWADFASVERAYQKGGNDGIGFVFAKDGGMCGIDLDGCWNPETSTVAPWAKEIIRSLGSYAELSPSETGVKVFVCGKNPLGGGRKIELPGEVLVAGKTPAIEMYDYGRYFAVTGWRLAGPCEVEESQAALDWIAQRYFPPVEASADQDFRSEPAVVERARKYLARLPGAVSGSKGHHATFHAACVLLLGFGLAESDARVLLQEWNQLCQPPWSDRELEHKIRQALKQPGPRNYLRNATPARWQSISVPSYQEPAAPPPKSEPKVTTLFEATTNYLDRLKAGGIELIELGLPSLDIALDGGVEKGELIVLAARPSHGKSAVALQLIHNWTQQQRICMFISEEMSAMALGKRALQFATGVKKDDWDTKTREVEQSIVEHFAGRSDCIIVESCRTADAAAEKVRWAVKERACQCVIIDYAQLLTGKGGTRYEQVTYTSITMRQLANELKIVLVLLCQLNAEIEKRPKFKPILADIKDSGQFAQDADVILFLCWPYRLDSSRDMNEYQFFVAKNRNRGIIENVVTCRFEPKRQMFKEREAIHYPNYEKGFADFNNQPFSSDD
jgi:archaellum biogenesis ATPase FlaH